MAEVLLLHHALGLTPGVVAFADLLRGAGHTVHTPDLYDGHTYATLDDGMAHARRAGFETLLDRGKASADGLPDDLVYVGFSLGVMSAQALVQTRPGARGAVFLHGAIPTSEFGGGWPAGVPLQVHTMADDDWGDLDVARELAQEIEGAEVFVYPGDQHLFTDESLDQHDEAAAALVRERVLAFLERLG